MAWIELHQNLREHRKLFACADELKVSRIQMVGILVSIWLWALDNTPTGSFENISNRTIARICDWPEKKADTLIDALHKTGWFDKEGESFCIHDWYDYAGKLMERREKDRVRKNKSSEKPKVSTGNPAEELRKSCATVPNSTVPYPTVPNSTVPNHNTVRSNTVDGTCETAGSAPAKSAGSYFTEFWELYPIGKGGNREEAWTEWKEHATTVQVAKQIIEGLKLWIDSDSWADDGGRYIPGAAKFIREERWKVPPDGIASTTDDYFCDYSETLAYAKKLMQMKEAGEI